ncbi:MAG: Gfo/Idh/MocA family protein [Flexilinea sp.]
MMAEESSACCARSGLQDGCDYSEREVFIMKFLIAGYGSIGRRHMRNLQECGEKNIILLRSNKSTLPKDEIKDIPVETEIENALMHKPDGVVIANPTALHLDIAIPAAKAGCAILLEKPISGTLERIPELKSALTSGGGKLLMGFQYRFHPGLLKARELIASGIIGRPLSFRALWGEYLPGWHPWEDYRKAYSARSDLGGGVALTLCHPLDYIRWLFGEISMIWGFSGKISDLEIAVDDLAEIGMQLGNGMVGTIHLDYFRRPGGNEMEVVGTDGVLHWDNTTAVVTVQNSSHPGILSFPPKEGFERNWLFLDEIRHFVEVTKRETEPSCTLDDGIITEQMVQALRRSWDEKRMIPLSEVKSIG